MHLSKTADHALRAVLYLAQHEEDGPMPADRIAEALGAPANYLSKTLHQLARAGVVQGYRGPKGGFLLAVPSDELPLADVIEAFDDHSKRDICLMGDRPCDESDPCGVHQTWTSIIRNARRPLEHNTVADLLAGRCVLPHAAVTEVVGD